MDTSNPKRKVSELVYDLGLAIVDPEWSGVDPLWDVLERIASEGAVVLLKIDGERNSSRYTAHISGGSLGPEDFFRADCETIEEGIAKVILHYADKVWQKS